MLRSLSRCQLFPPLVATTQQTAAVDGRYTDSHRHGAAASRPQTDRVVISVRRSVSLGSSVRPIFSRVRRATRRGVHGGEVGAGVERARAGTAARLYQ